MKPSGLMERTTNRLLGKTPAEEKKIANVRTRIWYARWMDLAKFLKGNPSDAAILRRVHSLLDSNNLYGHANNAYSSKESLEQAIEDSNEK